MVNSLFVVCGLWFVFVCLLCVVCLLFFVCCLLFVVCCLLFVVCCLLFVVETRLIASVLLFLLRREASCLYVSLLSVLFSIFIFFILILDSNLNSPISILTSKNQKIPSAGLPKGFRN